MAAFKSPKKAKSAAYPEPLVVPPILTHQQTFIILHGRGSNADAFGPPLLSAELPDGRTFQTALPHAKFIFPTASKRRAQIYNRSLIHQWFDNASLSTPSLREELMMDGLRESSAYIHGLLMEAAKEVGGENVVLGGLSQGCAAALISLLTWEGEPFAAAFGMCGWLPLQHHIADITDPQASSDDSENPFAREGGTHDEADLPAQAVAWLREELDLSTSLVLPALEPASVSPQATLPMLLPFHRVPLFLGHGVEDEKVKIELGHDARDCLKSLQLEVDWREYEYLGHWYSGQMLGDLVQFLEEKAGLAGKAGDIEEIKESDAEADVITSEC